MCRRWLSAGAAIIALGCDEIVLQQHAKIGDAAPITIRAGQQFERAPEKILSFLREELKTLAEKKAVRLVFAKRWRTKTSTCFK